MLLLLLLLGGTAVLSSSTAPNRPWVVGCGYRVLRQERLLVLVVLVVLKRWWLLALRLHRRAKGCAGT